MENLATTPETMTQEKKNNLLEKVLNIICDIFYFLNLFRG